MSSPGTRGRLASLPEDVEDGPQLGERLLARVADRGERRSRLLGERLVHVQRDARLDADERQVVPQRVVELARDPEPLLARAPQRLLLVHPGRLGAPLAPDPDDLGRPNSTRSQAASARTTISEGAGPSRRKKSSQGNRRNPETPTIAAASR